MAPLCRTTLKFHFLSIFAFLGRAGAHSSHFSPFFIYFLSHFFFIFTANLNRLGPGSKNEEKMTRKMAEKWPKIVTVSNPIVCFRRSVLSSGYFRSSFLEIFCPL